MNNKLNLGCGNDYKTDYINLDFEGEADVKHNLNSFPYPFKDSQFKEIVMRNILEHLDNPYNVMKEIHRISKPNAKIFIRVPHFSSIHVWADIQHKRPFSVLTFSHENLNSLFEVINQRIEIPRSKFFLRPIIKHAPIFYEKYLAYIFTATDLTIELRVKDIRRASSSVGKVKNG